MNVLDLFAGPGGWDLAAKTLGLDPLGIEWDGAACETRAAAGLGTKQADVAALDPQDFAPCDLLIASPPCQAFSRAGKREGIEDLPHVYEAALAMAEGRDVAEIKWRDDRAALVTEPLRWALALEPDFLAWEQVPDVLPFWRYCSGILEPAGWHTWTGILEAERYGVPQTRERAILLASRLGPVEPPRPTHQRYVKGEPQRHEVTLEGEVLPWVSMAEALGWAETGRAYRLARGEGMLERHGERRAVPEGEPAPVISSKARTAEWVQTNNFSAIARDAGGERSKAGSVPYKRPTDEPAPTLDTHVQGWTLDRPAPTIVTTRRSDKGILVGRQLPEGEGRNVGGWGYNPRQVGATLRDGGEPAPTMLAQGLAHGVPVWDDDPNACPKAGPNAVRVSLEEAAILQSFPPDYPFQGSRTACFTQVGNAVPPLLAHAVLSSLVGSHLATQSKAPA